MEQPNERYIDLEPKDLLEVTIAKPDDFLKVRETLTRIGVSSRKEKIADKVPLNKIKILPHKEKGEWELCPKYHIGRSKPGNKPESED